MSWPKLASLAQKIRTVQQFSFLYVFIALKGYSLYQASMKVLSKRKDGVTGLTQESA